MNTNLKEDITTMLRRMILEIILHPQHLQIKTTGLTRSMTINIQAHKGDTSRIIGTSGAHFRAFKALMAAMGARRGITVTMPKVQEPVIGEADNYPPLRESDEWPQVKIMELVRDVALAIFKYPEAVKVLTQDGEGAVTAVELLVDKSEKLLADALQPHLETLLEAIGNTHGRTIKFLIVPSAESEQQPDSADGRFSRTH